MRADQLRDRTAATAATLRRNWITRGQLALRYGISRQGATKILDAVEAEHGPLEHKLVEGEVHYHLAAAVPTPAMTREADQVSA